MDGADDLFEMGYEPQIEQIVENTRPDRQMLIFSATFPRQVEIFAREVLTNPIVELRTESYSRAENRM
ncbi:Dead-box atp-dependent rna helicase [Thalictrum thalictroides]|uniref:Dead-box atp-dependent rna helicase n=1 Tax=Thalictrum thalictroides TaxID=46969 RepID=A0A7J6WR59_THATH|nr:Dead-box atp-dependent rna helicase [Thalictrum thalictroides]